MTSSKRRLAFFRQAQTHSTPRIGVPHSTGVPGGLGTTLGEHAQTFKAIGNSGNMIHRAAMVQLLEFDRDASAQVNLIRLLNEAYGAKGAARIINETYDGLVITMSNIFRKGATEEGMAELLEELRVPIYCLGAGLQDDLPIGDATAIDPSIMRMMRVIDEKGALLGVRGATTQKWMLSVGFRSAKAIGCPSMFAYPNNILGLKPPARVRNVISAGHLHFGPSQLERAKKLIKGLDGIRTGYVFQGETRSYRDLLDVPGLYNEATQQVKRSAIDKLIQEKAGLKSPFIRYYSFTEVSAWRQACLQYDAYAGDRIHGGVAALQAGVPALILYADLRVNELATHHGIPSCSLDEFSKLGCLAAIEKYLNAETIGSFKIHYREAYKNFVSAVEESGLRVANKLEN